MNSIFMFDSLFNCFIVYTCFVRIIYKNQTIGNAFIICSTALNTVDNSNKINDETLVSCTSSKLLLCFRKINPSENVACQYICRQRRVYENKQLPRWRFQPSFSVAFYRHCSEEAASFALKLILVDCWTAIQPPFHCCRHCRAGQLAVNLWNC